ncbi:hypothetical protein SAMD00019534_083200 [Acytostelium subglobosum LB1]|uniref:hypothetical protein n=1 Tax=Acytostelium subglobosum LB1 TaxID=1410327 RepID=UPI000645151D|nr:hypothetical protein SAMD00019534_083200 [Acytostelium subglobosum LB1]GAM25145.1 hypothetical protein SAMD00019534_083200 [Acytostelium subglobosum LB1]|eukprot:XP_012751665.1 hypothetical protein SAMD00019534_083200 [Acytostelium subglobosum LB1]
MLLMILQRTSKMLTKSILHRMIGIAYYDTNLSILYVSETWEDDNFCCLKMVIQQINPRTLIIPSRMPEKFVECIQKCQSNSTSTHFSKSSDFTYDVGLNKLVNMKLPVRMDYKDKLSYLQRTLDFEKKEMMKAVGGLLSYLSKYLELDDFETLENFQVNEIISFSFEGFLNIDLNSLYSLQIFANEKHPSCYTVGNSKEGLSLFGIINRTKSIIGKRKLTSWFMRPPRTRDVIEERQSIISYLIQKENSHLVTEIQQCLANIKDLHMILNRLKMVTLLESHSDSGVEYFSKSYTLSTEEVVNIYNIIEQTFELDRFENNKLQIKHGVDEQLDQLKDIFSNMGATLTKCGEEEKTKFIKYSWITTFHFVYYPQLGCLICIPISNDLPLAKQRDINGLKFMFQTSEYLYYQNEKTVELDNHFGDIHNDILDIESRIERRIVDEILANINPFVTICNYCAELDALQSLAIASRELGFTKPTINSDNVIEILNGRHPLQEMCVPTFIPNNCSMTGPNQSGKSIYLKQVALIVFLAHLGCFVPAERANISLCDRIFTRVSSRESNSISESSFMIDCKQIAQMTNFSTPNSLLIIDEYGKGTTPQDGISLLCGLIMFLIRRDRPPRTLLCTHFYEIFNLLTDRYSDRISFNSMEFLISESDRKDTLQLNIQHFVPLYRVKEARSFTSFGLSCALNAGVPEDVLRRAQEIIEHQKEHKRIDCLQLSSYNGTLASLDKKTLERYNSIIEAFFSALTSDSIGRLLRMVK